jgi:galactokinase
MLKDMNGFTEMTLEEIALIGQFAENKYVGVNCGIMDQFAVAMAKADQAIFLDTNKLNYQYVPVKLKNHKIVIACSNKKRSLAESKYNERRSECEAALVLLQTKKKITCLCELTAAEFDEIGAVITDDVLYRRARHTIYENERTKGAVTALENNQIEKFGKLMNDSHTSLRDDYEVTGKELDTLVEEAWKCEGVVGSRMTGAGFGGCTVSIVRDDCVEAFIAKVGSAYQEKIGYSADFYVAGVGDGAHKFNLTEL